MSLPPTSENTLREFPLVIATVAKVSRKRGLWLVVRVKYNIIYNVKYIRCYVSCQCIYQNPLHTMLSICCRLFFASFLLLSKHLFSITLIIIFTYIYIIHQPVQQHEEHLPYAFIFCSLPAPQASQESPSPSRSSVRSSCFSFLFPGRTGPVSRRPGRSGAQSCTPRSAPGSL